MQHSVELGQEVEKDGEMWRIIRIARQASLVQDRSTSEGPLKVMNEHFLELKNAEGNICFQVLSSERTTYEGPESSILPFPELTGGED